MQELVNIYQVQKHTRLRSNPQLVDLLLPQNYMCKLYLSVYCLRVYMYIYNVYI